MDKSNLFNRSLFAFSVSFLSLTLFLFILNVLIRQFSDKSLWETSVAVFSLLGILLTAGAEFATIAAIISYISINDKLKKAESDLDIAKEALGKFRQLDDERKALEKANHQLKEYKTAVQGLDNPDYQDPNLSKHIETVLSS